MPRQNTQTVDNIRKYFPDVYFERGMDYYQKGYVVELDYEMGQKNTILLHSEVAGSGKDNYRVKIKYQPKGSKAEIDGVCSCPMRYNCKHVAATLIAFLSQDEVVHEKQHIPQLSEEVNSWLQSLDKATQQAKQPKDVKRTKSVTPERVLFFLHEIDGELYCDFMLARILKSGEFGKIKECTRGQNHIGRLPAAITDLYIQLNVLAETFESGTHFAYAKFEMTHAQHMPILREMVETGNTFWQDISNPIKVIGKPRPAKLHWAVNTQGDQYLEFVVDGKRLKCFYLAGLWYYDHMQQCIGPCDTAMPANTIQALLDAPVVSMAEAKVVNSALEKQYAAVELPPLNLSKKEVNIDIKPTAVINVLAKYVPALYEVYDVYRGFAVDDDFILIELQFKYANFLLSWYDERETLSEYVNDEYRVYRRDKDQEADIVDFLESECELKMLNDIVPSHYGAFANFADTDERDYDLTKTFVLCPYTDKAAAFASNIIETLKQQQYQVNIAEDLDLEPILDLEALDDWYVDIDQPDVSYNWFEMGLGVTHNGQKINLLPVLHAALTNPRIDMQLNNAAIGDDDRIILRDENNARIAIKKSRLQQLLAILLSVFNSNKEKGEQGQPRLTTMDLQALNQIDAVLSDKGVQTDGPAYLLDLKSKLNDFSGIDVVAAPKGLQATLRDYQQQGLNWFGFLQQYQFGGILADDMGLGKTVQTLAHICSEHEAGRLSAPVLVVAPTSLMYNWQAEAKKFTPHLTTVMLHGPDRHQYFTAAETADVIFTTYPLIVRDEAWFLEQKFSLVILDEAHTIKNPSAKSTKIINALISERRLCLTGTPIENNLLELWSLMNFVLPGLLGSQNYFKRHYKTPIEKHKDIDRQKALYATIRPFILRRTKTQVLQQLPPKTEIVRHVELEGKQEDLYETLRLVMDKKVREAVQDKGVARSHILILEALLKLRQTCCDPRLLPMKEADAMTADDSAKLRYLMDELLPTLLAEDRKILLFSQFTSMLSIIEREIKKQNIKYTKLTGSTKDRQQVVKAFQEGDAKIFLISLKAGGVGLNLTAADTVIHYDPWWNPAAEQQATDRAHRIGQENPVFVYKLITKGTVEETILTMQERKKSLVESVLGDDLSKTSKITSADLEMLFKPVVDVQA